MCNPRIFDTLLEIAIDDPVKRAHNRLVWVGVSELNQEFLKPMMNPEDDEERLVKSVVVLNKAVNFVESFTDACGKENATLYCHLAVKHIPDMVRDTPVDISQLSQQYVEAALKQAKADMYNFNNKWLRDETNDLGRNYQDMAKDWERLHMKREVAMPLNRNEQKQLGDGSKEEEKAVEQAERKGLLASRSTAQIEKKVERKKPLLEEILADYHAQCLLLTAGEEEEQPASLIPSSSVPGESGERELGTGAPGRGMSRGNPEGQGPGQAPQTRGAAAYVSGSTAARSAAMRELGLGGGSAARATPGGLQSTQEGMGRGARGGAWRGSASRGGAKGGATRGRGRGAGRGRGRTAGGRWIPASAVNI
jgi:hypothetical protein